MALENVCVPDVAPQRVVPDMKFATLAQCPVLGGKVKHVDDDAAKKYPACVRSSFSMISWQSLAIICGPLGRVLTR